jgi:hypothetical protein
MMAASIGATAQAQTKEKWMSNSDKQRYDLELTEKELEEERNRKYSLVNELFAVGEQFHCWFTIERASTPTSSTLELARFKIDYDIESIDALQEVMQAQLDGAVIRKNPKHPRVLHVIDAALAKDPNYALDKPATLKYSGVVGELPDKIGEVVPTVQTRRGGFGGIDMINDRFTRVKVDAKEMSVRNIFTNAVPIEKYEPVLWIAETFEQDGKRQTRVQFLGPRDRDKPQE